MSFGEAVYRVVPRLVGPALTVVAFMLLWPGLAKFTNQWWLRFVGALVGTILIGAILLLVLWSQATGS
jgi:hypothetical protein